MKVTHSANWMKWGHWFFGLNANAAICLSQCNRNPGVGIMLDRSLKTDTALFLLGKNTISGETISFTSLSVAGLWCGSSSQHTWTDFSNIQHFDDNLLIKTEGFSDWILTSKNRQHGQTSRISIVKKQALTVYGKTFDKMIHFKSTQQFL